PPPQPSPACGGGLGWGLLRITGPTSHRHFAVPHRRAGGQALGRVDNGVGVNAVVTIELVDRAGLAEMLNAECFEPMAPYAAEPTQRGGMAVDHGNYPAVSRQRRQQLFDMAEMRQAAVVAAQVSRRGPAGMQTIGRCNRQQPDIPAVLADQADRFDGVRRKLAGIGDYEVAIRSGFE